MADGLKTEIVSPEKLVLSAVADSVSVPGTDGYMTVMAQHAPMMTTLKPGFVSVVDKGQARTFYVRGGFADISPDGLTILAEDARAATDFNRAEIEAALSAAREALAKAESAEHKSAAQAVVDGWANLMIEAQALGPTVQA